MRKALWFGIGLATGVLLTMFLIVAAVEAAEPASPSSNGSDWSNLATIPPGARLEVKTRDNRTHRGEFLAFSEEVISLRLKQQDAGYRREDVLRVALLGPPKRGKAALKGFLIGVIPGALLGGVVAVASAGEEDDFGIGGKVTGALFATGLICGGVGAGIGAVVARPSRTVIYRRPPSPILPEPGAEPIQPMAVDQNAPAAATTRALLPRPLRDVYRTVSAEELARRVAWTLPAKGN